MTGIGDADLQDEIEYDLLKEKERKQLEEEREDEPLG